MGIRCGAGGRHVGGGGAVRAVFIVGHVPAGEVEAAAALVEEARTHGDLLMAEVAETYQSLTRKVLTLLQWSAARYPAAYVLKTDDDTYLWPDRIAQQLSKMPDGCLHWGAQLELNPQVRCCAAALGDQSQGERVGSAMAAVPLTCHIHHDDS